VRYAFVAASAFALSIAGSPPRVALADPLLSAVSSPHGGEQRAEELYLDGLEKLAAGHSDFARETFESVVERYPATEAAEEARRQLSQIKSNSVYGTGVEASADDLPATGSLPSLGETAEAPDAQPSREPMWDRELRRNVSIQSKMRREAGDRVFFSAGSAELGSRARSALSAQAEWLMRWHEFEAAIEGHADEPGTDQENIVLSQQRAEAVRQRLIDEGVEPSRLAVVPLGRSVRVATCADTDCRAQNRRAITLVFASGTRERLGLVSSVPLAAALGQPAAAVTVPVAKTAEVGVTR
jgi:peptidoglycan-associated lipoprotein